MIAESFVLEVLSVPQQPCTDLAAPRRVFKTDRKSISTSIRISVVSSDRVHLQYFSLFFFVKH